MNSESSKTSDLRRLLLNLSDNKTYILYQMCKIILSISSKNMKQRLIILQSE